MSSFKFRLRILKHPFLIQKVACKGFAKKNGPILAHSPNIRRAEIADIPYSGVCGVSLTSDVYLFVYIQATYTFVLIPTQTALATSSSRTFAVVLHEAFIQLKIWDKRVHEDAWKVRK